MRGGYKFVLLWSVFASVWIIAIAVSFFLYIYLPKAYDTDVIRTVTVITLFLGFPVLALSFFTIYISYKGYKRFKVFTTDFYPMWLRTRLNLSQSDEKELMEKINDAIIGVLPEFRKSHDVHITSRNKTFEKYDIALRNKKNIVLVKVLFQENQYDSIPDIISEMKHFPRRLRIKLLMIVMDDFSKSHPLDDLRYEGKIRKEAAVLIMEHKEGQLTVKRIFPPKSL